MVLITGTECNSCVKYIACREELLVRLHVILSKLTEHAASTLGFFNPEFQKDLWAAFSISMDMGLR
jgi:hypothetical protein